MLFDINGGEFLIIVVLALVLIGPERLPQYAASLARLVKRVRSLAAEAKDRVSDELGPELVDVDWSKLDPRQYDPRRIVRDALLEDGPLLGGTPTRSAGTGTTTGTAAATAGAFSAAAPTRAVPAGPAPFDPDAT